MRFTLMTLAVALAAAVVPSAQAATDIFPHKVHQTTLENGLRVVAIPYDSPGTIAYYTVVRTGSRDEVEPGHSGFAHFFEHMMFRGTERFSTDEYSQTLKRMGADDNAFTTDDYTAYHIVGPAAQLETIMDLESDRFRNLAYSEEDFRREALAVLGEYNKNISNPFLPMYERMRDLAFQRHTYKHTTMGFLADIQAMPDEYEYSLSFFDRFYRPENCIVLVVGDIDPERVFALARRFYGEWERGYKAPAIETEGEPEAGHAAHIDWAAPIRPHMMIGFRAPAFSADRVETAALDLVGQLLFSESAPLYQKLVVDEQWVDFVSGGYSDHRDPYLFTIYTRVKSDDLVAKVQAAIDEHIGKLQSEPIDEARLERIKSHLRYGFALGLDSPDAVAGNIAHFLNLTGDPLAVNRVFEQYAKVTPEDVQTIAKSVFQPQRRTVVTLGYSAPAETPASADDLEGK